MVSAYLAWLVLEGAIVAVAPVCDDAAGAWSQENQKFKIFAIQIEASVV